MNVVSDIEADSCLLLGLILPHFSVENLLDFAICVILFYLQSRDVMFGLENWCSFECFKPQILIAETGLFSRAFMVMNWYQICSLSSD